MRINNNLMAMNTHRQLGINAGNGAKSIEKLSSGYRINRAGDDAAGLAISEKMRGQIRGLNQASRNSQDAISMIQTAEGALNETQAILQRMRELAVQSANDTNVSTDRDALQNEINQLSEEITRISSTTEFNTQKLLNGTLSDIKFQIGANETQELALSVNNMSANALDIVSDTITMDSKGEAIKSVSADADFDIEGATLSATAGGAVAAKLTSKEATTEKYAADLTMNFSVGVTNANSVGFNGTGKISLSSAGDIPWDKVNTSGGTSGLIQIGKSGDYVTVKINITASGENQFDVTDAILADASGNFVYDNHGLSFTVTGDEVASLSGGANTVKIDLENVKASGAALNFSGDIDVLSNYANTYSGSDKAAFTGGKISLDAASDQWLEGAYSITVSGGDMTTSGSSITVQIKGLSGELLATDTVTFSGANSGVFSYDEHGISFDLDFNATNSIKVDAMKLNVKDEAVAVSGTMGIKITDQNGTEKTLALNMTGGYYELDEIADEINSLASGAGISGDVASVVDGSIVLQSINTGADASVSFSGVGSYGAVFTVTDTAEGSDSSINFTLKDSAGSTIDTETGVAASATRVKLTDSDGNSAIFELKGYDTLEGVDVEAAFAASGIDRTTQGIDISSQENAAKAITTINDAIESVSQERSKLGAVQNRLEHTIKNLDTSAENLQASESRIRDVDMAKEMMEFTKNNILQQAAQAMLAQANQAPQGVLQLLR